MSNIKAILIDDEESARETLAALLETYTPEVRLLTAASSASEGLEAIEKLKPDLVFLDIEMPFASGFDLLDQLPAINFAIVFTTAYQQYSLKAIKFSALDYLLKPIRPDELKAAVAKAKNRSGSTAFREKLRILEENLRNVQRQYRKIVLPTAEGLEIVEVQNIVRCEGDVNYTRIWFVDGKKILLSRTLREYEELLTDSGFFRIFQSHLVNLRHVHKYLKGRGGNVEMSDGSVLPVSRDRKKDFLEALNAFL